MREAAFIKRNEAKWKRLEQVLTGLQWLGGDEASDLYIQLNDDLSYARTFYPKSPVTTYLNGLAVRLHQHIYRNKRTPARRFLTFWKHEIPLAVYQARYNLLIAFSVFAIAFAIGAVSTRHDPTFSRLMLGDDYVDMTLENIRNGRPMDVYNDDNSGLMFIRITSNNIRVSFNCFAAGLLPALGTGLILMYNGVMIGSFQYLFHEQGVLQESLLTIWIHGTLEISAIIIASGAGLCLGSGWLFPGTYTRGESFRRGALTGVKVAIGLVPVFIIAGFLESFVTRHALTVRPWVSLTIIFGSLAWVVYYFIILPYHANRRTRRVAPGA
jgi:uncharacterized membrane protein SpoIIM required for sporulation